MESLCKVLKSNNLKITPQRIAIYNYLCKNRNHPNAETIYNALKTEYPAMSLATVYKTVAVLRDAGLVQELNVGEDSFRYDACMDNHAHIICTKCHTVFDYFKPLDFKQDVTDISKTMDIEVFGQQTYFYGICSKCKDREK